MNEAEFTEVIPYLFIFMFGMSFVWLLISFGGGMHNFYKAQKLLSYILSLELFDNNNYSKSHIRENAWVFYTQECFLGDINGYPTILSISRRIDKFSQTHINFDIVVVKFNNTKNERISFLMGDEAWSYEKTKAKSY